MLTQIRSTQNASHPTSLKLHKITPEKNHSLTNPFFLFSRSLPFFPEVIRLFLIPSLAVGSPGYSRVYEAAAVWAVAGPAGGGTEGLREKMGAMEEECRKRKGRAEREEEALFGKAGEEVLCFSEKG